MKKYLMTGIAALAMCFGFTSCSHDVEPVSQEQLDQLEAEKVFNDYQNAFIKTFGQPAANQTWGFGGTAFTRSENPDANKWAADGYKAPTELSAQQKIRVMAYFQANPGLTYVDPEFKDFFVQQVYKGGTTPGAISAEVYHQTNGTPVIGSDHMDWLYMGLENGEPRQHINNYNKGRYGDENPSDPNGLPRENVQNWPDITYLNDNGDGTHKDHIMLILGESTETVGFHDSEGQKIHLDCCANAGAEVIDAWALAHRDSLVAIGKFGATVTDNRWNRSFVGLDYEQKTLEGLYSTQKTNAKALDFCISDYILYNGHIYERNSFTDFYLMNTRGENVRYISENVSNMGIADYIKEGNNPVNKDNYNYNMSQAEFKKYGVTIQNNDARVFNLDMIMGYIRQSAMPTENNLNWVKNIGGRDYVFSDWIVTLTEATQENNPYPKRTTLRVMAEDLSANEASDFDFNDVVLDFRANEDGTAATITLIAAGGTLPLRINQNDAWEVHKLFGVPVNTMVNTNATAKNLTGASKDPVVVGTVQGDFSAANFCKSVNAIKLEVYKNNQWMELSAKQGVACCKFGCDPRFEPVPERDEIDDYYNFSDWVKGFTTTLTRKNN
jgi:hypothetical protein